MEFTYSFRSKVVALAAASALVVGSFFAVGLSQVRALTEDQIQSILNLLRSFGADQQTLSNVEAALRGQAPAGGNAGAGSVSSVCPYQWQRNLGPGDTGEDVKKLQQFLNERGFTVASSGPGSPGNETTYYGSRTGAAVKQFQEAYASEILAPLGLSEGTPYFWTRTRAKANELCAQAQQQQQGSNQNQQQGGQSQAPATNGVAVAPGTQPANGLFVENAARVPFTVFTLTAGSQDVTVNGVTVKKTGSMSRAAFNGVMLLDENGVQLGNTRYFNAADEAVVGGTFTVPAGQTRTFTVAANAPSNLDNFAGQVGGISVVGINTDATVNGSLPITGAMHTVNATLAIGSLTAQLSSLDPNADQTKQVGTTNYRFAGVRFTAGSQEAVRLKGVRFNQVGSVASSDLANVRVEVNGVSYPAQVSADGNYYTAMFGSNGVVVGKGESVDVVVVGDIVGSNAAGRTVDFDIEEASDVYAYGETYGYGILPTGSGARFGTNPFFNGHRVTVQGGQATLIQKSNSVPAQNIAINAPDQPLGAFSTTFTGEGMMVQGFYVGFNITGGQDATDLTNVVLLDENGAVVAGPADGMPESSCGAIDGGQGCVFFSEAITFPTGSHTYTLKGRTSSQFSDGDTIQAVFTANTTHFVNPKGEVTGDPYSLPGSPVTMNTMTVKGPALAVSVASDPASQNIVAGVQNQPMMGVILDATNSGDDLRLGSLTTTLAYTGISTDEQLVGCQIFDGSTPLNTGGNVINNPAAGNVTFTFDNPLTVNRGTSKTLTVKCTVPTTADSGDVYTWLLPSDIGPVTAVQAGTNVTETVTSSNVAMTVANGSFTVAKADDSPTYRVVPGGATGVTLAKLKVRATNEDMELRKMGFQLTGYAAGQFTQASLAGNRVSIWHNNQKVGEVLFTGQFGTSTFTTPVSLPKDQDVTLTLMADMAPIGPSQPGIQGAHVRVDYAGAGGNHTSTEATGQASGQTITSSTTSNTATDGVRVFRSFPTVAKQPVPSTSIVAGTMDLYRFSVSADAAGNVKLNKVTVNIATSTGTASQGTTTVTNLRVYAYTDSGYTSPVSGFTNGQVASTIANPVNGDNNVVFSSVLTIPAGSTYYFRVVGDVTTQAGSSGYSGSITTKLSGDAAFPTCGATTATNKNMCTFSEADGDANDDFIWSADFDGTTTTASDDWTNGYGLPGLPADGTDVTTLSK